MPVLRHEIVTSKDVGFLPWKSTKFSKMIIIFVSLSHSHSAGKHDRCFYTHALARPPLKYTIENLTSWSEGDTTLKNTSVYNIKQ